MRMTMSVGGHKMSMVHVAPRTVGNGSPGRCTGGKRMFRSIAVAVLVAAALAAARQALGALGGSVVISAAPDEVHAALDPWGAPPAAPVLALMKRLKAQLDPEGRLAPGRMVGGI